MATDTVKLEAIIGGGQTIGTLKSGKKALLWGGIPGETVEFLITKKKAKLVEGVVTKVLSPSGERIVPKDPDSYLSTSPWQIMTFAAEQRYKAQLIDEAFMLHHVKLPTPTTLYSDDNQYHYRNKVEFSWYGSWTEDQPDAHDDKLDLAFFRRGGKGKVPVDSMSLARPEIMKLALAIRDLLQSKHIIARQLKTLLIRCNQSGDCVWQLYTKDKLPEAIAPSEANALPAQGGEIIYSDPRSPASRITERLASFGNTTLTDTILGVPFRYATEGFFQVNLPVYEKTLKDIEPFVAHKKWHMKDGTDQEPHPNSQLPIARVVDLYSGVGTIGLTIGGDNCTLVEIDEHAVREMKRNVTDLKKSSQVVLAPSEKALEYITSDTIVIVDPPRAGLHADVVDRLLETKPPRIIYLSCNPVTQARDIALLLESYKIVRQQGYNFFPRTPHIEHLIVLDAAATETKIAR